MNIIVCIKQIPDPEIPPAKFRLDDENKAVLPPEGIPPVINPYDACAVELALQLKEKHGGKITAVSTTEEVSGAVLKHALSMGVDDGIILSDPAFNGSDSFSVAHILTKAIEKIGEYDLILCGRQAVDWDEGLVGPIIAESLGLPLVTQAMAIEVAGQGLEVKRTILEGYQKFSVPIPAVVTVSNEVGKPRLPTGWGIIAAARKTMPVWNAQDIQADLNRVGPGAARRKLSKLSLPERKRRCEIIGGETTSEAAASLVTKLKEAGIV